MKPSVPLVYSCSGASSAAQMANHIAVKLDRLRVAEMSCIAGLGGDVKPLVQTAKSGRSIIAVDGCPLHCAAKILQRHGLRADKHFDLSRLNVGKRQHEDFDPGEATHVLKQILDDLKCEADATRPILGSAPICDQGPLTGTLADAADDEIPECASPPCYLSELENMKGPEP